MSKHIEITFLGTGDAVPSKARNHSSILLQYSGENMLFDCGEGTQRQFRYAELNPCKVNKIFITHWHGDHVLGLPGMLQTLALSGYMKNLTLYGPKGTKRFMENMFKTFVFDLNFPFKVVEIDEGIVIDEEDYFIEAKRMEHGVLVLAYNFVLKNQRRIDSKKLEKLKLKGGPYLQKLKEGKDVVFEGKKLKSKELTYVEEGKKISIVMDTKMNSGIVPFVKNSDVVIMESAFGSELEDKAREYNHMTSKQVAEIAKKAKVGKIYLTHISSRYVNPKPLIDEAKKIFKNSELAKDLMRITV
jgi:ribonuclease Z